MHVDQWIQLPIEGLDDWTAAELYRFIERKLDEQAKIKGQIAKDLRRIGEMAFLDPTAYLKLRAKYQAGKRLSRKKLAILELMRKEQCKC
ncbi:MAG: hypothetical protein IJQ82_00920 [Selenomonadaceae bacterium]|nr:hypothetical protein [Selenomonadaceae bacterium]